MKVVKSKMKRRTGTSSEKINPRKIHRDYLDTLEDELANQGVVFFDQDTGLDINDEFLQLPREITEITSRDLGEYLNAFTQQKVYLRTVLGRTEIMEEETRRAYFDVANEVYRDLSAQKLSETAKDRIINSDEEVQPLYEAYQNARKRVQLVKYAIDNVEDICFLISREVTRRNGDFEGEMRASNIKNRR